MDFRGIFLSSKCALGPFQRFPIRLRPDTYLTPPHLPTAVSTRYAESFRRTACPNQHDGMPAHAEFEYQVFNQSINQSIINRVIFSLNRFWVMSGHLFGYLQLVTNVDTR